MTGARPEPHGPGLKTTFIREGGWLGENLSALNVPALPIHEMIEIAAAKTNEVGKRPLWAGYREIQAYPRSTTKDRKPNQVRVAAAIGRFFTWLASMRRNPQIVEIGTAFGISGMYWLAGIGQGHLYTFDPNPDWGSIARENLHRVSGNFTLTVDTFENAGPMLIEPASADIAFVDAIHTPEVVRRQFELLKPTLKPGALVVFDDICFSEGMRTCWSEIASSPYVTASATLGRRTGIIELT